VPSAFVVLEALRRLAAHLPVAQVTAVATTQEEISYTGGGARTSAFALEPVAAIVVDVTHATDCPTVDQRQRGTITLGGGPVIMGGPNVNPRVRERLLDLAGQHGIPHQVAALGRAASNDANPVQLTRAGVATGLVQIPNRYMHSGVETIALADLDHTANLLAAFAATVADAEGFIP